MSATRRASLLPPTKLTASPEARAHRRWLELQAAGTPLPLAQVEAETRQRDAQDAARATAPMKPAPDAVLLDTTALAAWFTGQLLGRTLIEIGPSDVDPDRWNEISIEAVFAVAFEPDDRA
jgi:hypothetical protein